MKCFWLIPLACLASCLSPTLPLPPPEEPDGIAASVDEGVYEVRGRCTPGAVVLVQNIATGLIWGVEDKDGDGRYFVRVDGEMCDPADVTESIGNATSQSTFFFLETRINGLTQGECE
jgi:hypothetical protein